MTAHSEGSHVFDAAGNNITCLGASFHATSAATSTASVTMSGGYVNCTFFGVNVNVNMNSCDYLFQNDNTSLHSTPLPATSPTPKKAPLCGSQTEGRYTSGPAIVTGESGSTHVGVFFS